MSTSTGWIIRSSHYPTVAQRAGQVRWICKASRTLRRFRFAGITPDLIACPACRATLERIGRSIHRAHGGKA